MHCRHCGREGLSKTDFYASSPHKCRACCAEWRKAWRAKHPEETRKYAREAQQRKRAEWLAGQDRFCDQCGTGIPDSRAAHARYCSRDCTLIAQEARRRERRDERRQGRLCKHCGEPIPVSRNLKAVTCSHRCRDALNERALMHRRCRQLTLYAIKVGRLHRQPCEVCGSSEVEAHHVDYFDPLNVRWLCFLHHRRDMHGHEIREEQTCR